MYTLKGKNVVVIGLGVSGVAAAGFTASRGAEVTVTDSKPEKELKEALAALNGFKIAEKLGRHDPEIFSNADLVIISPGVPTDIPGLDGVRHRGVPVISEMELALQEISKPIIAVTGTNGKTTTTKLIGHLLDTCGVSNCVGGNLGTPLTSMVERSHDVDWVVLEVSSFQLETTPSLAPAVAVWLNATPDHLDRHSSFEEYVEIKSRLFAPLTKESWAVYNYSDDVVRNAVLSTKAVHLPFDPQEKRKDGGWYEDGDLWVDVPSRGRYRFSLQKTSLEGRHNRENMLAAILSTLLAGGNVESIQEGLDTFQGLAHRLEFVTELNGVRYYDDSKGTNVGATMRALDSFAEPVVLIAGGLGKGADFEKLKPLVDEGVKKLILIGQSSEEMQKRLGEAAETERASSMEDAVVRAWKAADPGDVVLLSPACASFDMFRNYAHRGEVFKDAVEGLKKKRRRNSR